MNVLYRLLVLSVAMFVIVLPTSHARAECVSGTVTAEFQFSGPFTGLWKYTVDLTWDIPQGLSNITLDCGFSCNPSLACAQTYVFDDPAGTGEGEPAPCMFEFAGEFNCSGNPSVGINYPVIKWDAVDADTCQAGNMGSGILCFYTNVGPHPDAPLPIIIEKDGQNVCSGELMGDCPAVCVVPVEESTWGNVKGKYEK